MLLITPSHLKTSLSTSPTAPVPSAISEFGILKVEAGSIGSPERFLSLAMMVVVGLVADEGADRAHPRKPFGQIRTELGALGRDIGKARYGKIHAVARSARDGDDESRRHLGEEQTGANMERIVVKAWNEVARHQDRTVDSMD